VAASATVPLLQAQATIALPSTPASRQGSGTARGRRDAGEDSGASGVEDGAADGVEDRAAGGGKDDGEGGGEGGGDGMAEDDRTAKLLGMGSRQVRAST
jgi:hypothetical protein